MIISNAVPKAGGHLLYAYLGACGLAMEPGELYADIDVSDNLVVTRRPVGGSTKDIWDGVEVRPYTEMLADRSTTGVINAHVHDGIDLSGHRVAFMYRHPRNVLVSAARFSAVRFDWTRAKRQPTPRQVRQHMSRPYIKTAIARCEAFAGWLDRADVAVRFEDMTERPAETGRRISEALGLPAADPSKVLGDATPWVTETYRGTWSGKHSDWREIWTEGLDRIWSDLGGPDVERLYGF